MRPVIGVTCGIEAAEKPIARLRLTLNAAYSDALYAAGGLPQPIATPAHFDENLIDELLSHYDGLLLTGGPDLDPQLYGQPRHARTEVMHERRGAFDIELFRRADALGLPMLSICLGCQIANVARGGQLVQHVDDRPATAAAGLLHHQPDGGSTFHTVRVEADSRLGRILGTSEIEVNSRHHQAIEPREVGGRLRAVAFSPDGLVEAAEDRDGRFLIAVQWHPEDLTNRPEHLRLFQAPVEQAAKRRTEATPA